MPVAAIERPPRNGPIKRHFKPCSFDSSNCCARKGIPAKQAARTPTINEAKQRPPNRVRKKPPREGQANIVQARYPKIKRAVTYRWRPAGSYGHKSKPIPKSTAVQLVNSILVVELSSTPMTVARGESPARKSRRDASGT